MYQFISHPASCACCGGGKIEIDPQSWQGFWDAENAFSPHEAILKSYLGSSASATLISESDALARRDEMGLSSADWSYVSSLMASDANLFFKWGGELGTAPELTYSFVNGGAFQYDSVYTSDIDGDFGSGSAASFSNFSSSDSAHHMVTFSGDEQAFIRETLESFGDYSGITFTEVPDSTNSYGDIRFFLQDFNEWLDFESTYSAGGFAWMPWGDGWSGNTSNSWAPAGDVFLRSDYDLYNGYTETVIAHEIGHALGLSHPFDGGYNNIGNINDSLDNSYTIMTYDQSPELLGINPMPVDILAMEFLYGGTDQANLGDDTYFLDPELFDVWNNSFAAANGWSYGADARMSIVDDGGADIINANDITNGIFLNLAPGSWSNLSDVNPFLLGFADDGSSEQIASSFDSATSLSIASDADILNYGQVYIESETYIEQCNLTDYGDIIFDNGTDNIIRCEGGDDLVSLSFGSDQVFGGAGNDEVSIYGDASDYFAQMVGAGYELLNTNSGSLNYGKTIYLESVENISFYGANNQTTYNSDITSYYNLYTDDNEPPTIDFVSDQSVDENSYFSYQLNASDPDGDQLTFYGGPNFPDWLTITSGGLITGTPGADVVDLSHLIDFSVSDGEGGTDTGSFYLTVNELPNSPPIFDPIPDYTMNQGEHLEVLLSYSDPNGDDVGVLYVNNHLQNALWFDSYTSGPLSGDRTLIFNPQDIDVGVHEITVMITEFDDEQKEVFSSRTGQTFSLTVNNVNDTPYILPLFDQKILGEQDFSYQVIASDPDFDSGDTLTFSALELPDWLSISSDGLIAGNAPSEGEYNISVMATDTYGSTDVEDFKITVVDASDDRFVSEDYINQPEHEYRIYMGANTDMLAEFRKSVDSALEAIDNYSIVQSGNYSAGTPFWLGPFTGLVSSDYHNDRHITELSGKLNYLHFGTGEHQISKGHWDTPGVEFFKFSFPNNWLNQGNIKNTGIYARDFMELLIGSSDDGNAADILFELLLSDDNYLHDTYGDETIYAGSGDDDIHLYRGSDKVFGGEGNDRVDFSIGSNRIDVLSFDLQNNFVELWDKERGDLISLSNVEQVRFTESSSYISLKEFLLDYAPPNSSPIGDIFLEGAQSVGAVISVNTDNLADADGLGAFSYVWRVSGEIIEGVTSDKYIVQEADLGKEITVEVSYTDQWFNEELVFSAPFSIENGREDLDGPRIIPFDDYGQVVGNTSGGMLSSDGSYVLLTNGNDGDRQLYRKNLLTGEKEIVSADKNGNPATGDSIRPIDLSADGRFVLFTLDEYGDVKLDPKAPVDQTQQSGPLYRKDLDTGDIVRVDVLSDGSYVTPMWGVESAAISADGNYVVFEHNNTQYAGESASQGGHVYWKNLTTGELKVVDIKPDGTPSDMQAGSGGYGISISADGQFVTFLQSAEQKPYDPEAAETGYFTDLITGLDNLSQYASVYVRDMSKESGNPIQLVNSSELGAPSNDNSYGSGVALSADGSFAAFTSGASNLVDGVFGGPQVYVKNLLTGEILVASTSDDGIIGQGFSAVTPNSLSANGRYVAFESDASNIVSNDTNGKYDVFVKDLWNGGVQRISVSDGIQVEEHARLVGISDDGKSVTFSSYSSSIDPFGDNGSDIFISKNPVFNFWNKIENGVLIVDEFADQLTYVLDDHDNVMIIDLFGYELELSQVTQLQFLNQIIIVQDIYDSLITTGEFIPPPTLNQPTILGSGDDTFYGEDVADYVETGGGDDRIMSEGGDDHIVVQGAGEVIVDVGSGRDIVEVDPTFVGGLTITNGQETEVEASSLTIVIDKPAWVLRPASDTATNTDYKITLDGGVNEVLIKDYFFTDEEGYVTTKDISIRHQGWDGWDAGYTGMMWESVRGSNQDNLLYSSIYDRDKTDDYVPVVEDGIVYSMSGFGGDDVFYIGGGLNQIFGWDGDDAFYIDMVGQNTSIIGDKDGNYDGQVPGQYVNPSLKEDGLPDYDTVNTDFGDAAYFSFEWPTLIDNPDFNPNAVEDASNPRYLKDPDSYIEQLGKGHFKVHHKLENGEEINVEMYDVEGAYFSDGEGGLEYHALTSGRPITSDDFGNLAYDSGDVKFWVEHNDADYGGATTIAVVTTATKTVTDPVTKQKISYEEPSVKWKGLATEADSFVFSDVTINVINVAQTDLTGVPIDDTTVYGTAGIDLIIGDDSDNLIYGGANNDIIFGGAGNDEIYGEGGDDVLIGGVGEDILYGDYHEDALKPAEELDSKGKLMNASELDGDDIIVGGAGIDKIDSGEGQNIAASGDLSSVILNAELDEMHTFLDYDEDDLPV